MRSASQHCAQQESILNNSPTEKKKHVENSIVLYHPAIALRLMLNFSTGIKRTAHRVVGGRHRIFRNYRGSSVGYCVHIVDRVDASLEQVSIKLHRRLPHPSPWSQEHGSSRIKSTKAMPRSAGREASIYRRPVPGVLASPRGLR